MTNHDDMTLVRTYHQQTKHRPDRYAASMGFMDWPNQPNVFRSYLGTDRIPLGLCNRRPDPTYDALFDGPAKPRTFDAEFVSRFFQHSFALSARKCTPQGAQWSLRCIPSSGALYPTEAYLVAPEIPGLTRSPAVFHYAPEHHCLEQRGRFSPNAWAKLAEGFPADCVFVALTTIFWRESWKYGERAFRYCHLDIGHAIGAAAFAARAQGWTARCIPTLAGGDLEQLLGVDDQEGPESEHGDCLLALFPSPADDSPPQMAEVPRDAWPARIPPLVFQGQPNRLSRNHHAWPTIDAVSRASQCGVDSVQKDVCPTPGFAGLERSLSAESILLTRRSAQAMDETASLSRDAFFHLLHRTSPHTFPFAASPAAPLVSLVIFVHRVESMTPGLYLLARATAHEQELRQRLNPRFLWQKPVGCPDGVGLYELMPGDLQDAARSISCHQDIAANGVFSLGMLTQFEAPLGRYGAGMYPRLFWECGLIGQVLCLEAEAAGLRGTGIGCFFDDVMHDLLGLSDAAWQILYHFTVGKSIEDPRIQTLAPYHDPTSKDRA